MRNRSADRQRFANIATGAKRPDTRPINDRVFQNMAMARVYHFFQEQPAEFSNICPPPPFKNFYISSFTEIMQYLLQQFFPDVKINSTNYVTEIPIFMKKLGYPGNLTTSWLKTANAPHAWCHVVAVLSWLTDQLIYRDCSMDNDLDKYFVLHPEDICSTKAFFHYVNESFVAWNNGDDGKITMLDSEFIGDMRKRQITKKQIEALEAENETLQQDLDNPADKAQIAEEKALEEELKEIKKKGQTLREWTDKNKLVITAAKKEMDEISLNMDRSVKESEGLMEQRNKLDLAIASQELTVAEAEKMKAECVQLEGQCRELEIYKQEILKTIYTAEMKVVNKQKELHGLCVDYNTRVLADFNDHKGLTLETSYYSKNLEDQWREVDQNLDQLVHKLKLELNHVKRDKKARVCSAQQQEQKKQRLWAERDSLKKLRVEAQQKMDRLKEEYQAKEDELTKHHDQIKKEVDEIVKQMPDIEAKKTELKLEQERADRLKQELVFIQEKGMVFIERLVQILQKREEEMAKRIAGMTKVKKFTL